MAEITKELGRIPVSRGDYQATVEYYKDNIVQYKRGSYQVVSESPIIGVPPTNDKNIVNPGWTLFAGTLDAQDVVNQVKDQETKSIQAVAAREAEILAKSDAAEVSFDNTGTSISETNVQDALKKTDGKLSKLESEVIYDVTANNNGATFSSLSALLSSENLSTLIPASVRHGGMSIRFVQSSDNKYVQYFLTKNEWSASEADWEKMNLQGDIQDLQVDINKRVCIFPYGIDRALRKNGLLNTVPHFTVTPFIPVIEGETIECQGYSGGSSSELDYSLLCTYNSNKEFIAAYGNDGGYGLKKYSLVIPSGVAFIRVGSRDNATASTDYYANSYVNCRIIAKLLSNLIDIQDILENIENLSKEPLYKREYSESTSGKVINAANGNAVNIGNTYPNQAYSDFIPVKPGQSIWVSGWFGSQVGGAGYNQNQEYCSYLFDTAQGSPVYTLPEYSSNQKIIIPEGVYFIRSCSKDNVNYPLNVIVGESIQDTFTEVYDYIDNKVALSAPIRIHKVDSTHFYVAIHDNITNKDLLHYFVLQNYIKTLNYSDGLTKDVLCGDIWYPSTIVKDNVDMFQGNLNFIYLIDSSLTSNPSSPFYNEGSHVGAGHGCEIKEFQRFFADGEEFDIANMSSAQDLYCNEFRIVCKANNYALDTTQPGFSSSTATLKLDVNGDPILTAVHTYIATFRENNNIIWDNNLLIKRNGVIFSQCHGAMCQGSYPQLNNVVVMNDNYDNNDYVISGGSVTCIPIGTSANLNDNQFQTVEEVMLKGDGAIITQKMTQEGERYNKNYAKLQFYIDSGYERLKIYQQPVKTTWQFPLSSAETFNDGDIIKVHVERNIAILY